MKHVVRFVKTDHFVHTVRKGWIILSNLITLVKKITPSKQITLGLASQQYDGFTFENLQDSLLVQLNTDSF